MSARRKMLWCVDVTKSQTSLHRFTAASLRKLFCSFWSNERSMWDCVFHQASFVFVCPESSKKKKQCQTTDEPCSNTMRVESVVWFGQSVRGGFSSLSNREKPQSFKETLGKANGGLISNCQKTILKSWTLFLFVVKFKSFCCSLLESFPFLSESNKLENSSWKFSKFSNFHWQPKKKEIVSCRSFTAKRCSSAQLRESLKFCVLSPKT